MIDEATRAMLSDAVADLARVAEMELALAQTRHLVKREFDRSPFTDCRLNSAELLDRIDRLLDGTIHSFTHGAK